MTIVAATSKLISLDALKLELGIDPGDTSQDVYLDGLILQMSSVIETYLDRTLGVGTHLQTKNYQFAQNLPSKVFLVKYPVVDIVEVAYTWQDGATQVALDSAEYFFESDEGIMTLTNSGRQLLQDGLIDARCAATGSGYITISVEHEGGYDLPDEADTGAMELPEAISRACTDLSKNAFYTKTQNPTVKSEMVPDVLQQTYFQASGGSTGGGDGFVDGVLNSLDSYLDLRQAF